MSGGAAAAAAGFADDRPAEPDAVRSRPLAGTRALVVGAAGAIGQAIARDLAAAGATVLAADLRGATELVAGLGPGAHTSVEVDVTDLAGVQALVAGATAEGEVHAVVYAAGANTTGPIAELDWAEYDRVMDVNLRGAFHLAQVLAGPLAAQPSPASLVLLASTAGQRGEAGGSVYCASKFGLIGLMQSLAAELAPAGIRVNAVAPGNVDSPMLRKLAARVAMREGTDTATVLAALAEEAAARRLVAVEEVAAACTWLVSPAASGVTGTTVNVDAGTLSA